MEEQREDQTSSSGLWDDTISQEEKHRIEELSVSGVRGGVFYYAEDETETLFYVSQGVLELLNYTEEEFREACGNRFSQMIYPNDRCRAAEELSRKTQLADGGQEESCQYRVQAKGGEILWVSHQGRIFNDRKGNRRCAVTLTDLSSTRSLLEADRILISCVRLMNSGKDYETTMTQVLQSVLNYYLGGRAYLFEFDWQAQTFSNTFEVCAEGFTAEIEHLQNLPIDAAESWIRAFSHGEGSLVIRALEDIADDPYRREEYEILQAQNISGLMAVPIRYNGKLHGFIGVDDPSRNQQDDRFLISLAYFLCGAVDRYQLHQELNRSKYTDTLTGLDNRLSFELTVKRQLGTPVDNVGLLFVDINHLKNINDHFGHEYGDTLICKAARMVRDFFPNARMFRISGDELLAVCQDCPQAQFALQSQRLCAAFQEEESDLAAVGECWSLRTDDLRQMMLEAERAMYRRKKYTRNTADRSEQYQAFLKAVYQAMKKDTFGYELLPQFSADGRTACGEAVARRWNRAGEVIPAYQYIPLLDKEKLTYHLDYFVLDCVGDQMGRWIEEKKALIPVFVRFSVDTVQRADFFERYTQCCEKHNINPHNLGVDISGWSPSVSRERLSLILTRLQKLHTPVMLTAVVGDDNAYPAVTLDGLNGVKFGVKQLSQAESRYKSRIYLQSAIELCHRLGLRCVAVELENQRQTELARELGCDNFQGPCLGESLPPEDFARRYLVPDSSVPPAIPQESERQKISLERLASSLFDLLAQNSENIYFYMADLSRDYSRWSPSAVEYFGLPGEYIADTVRVWTEYIHPEDRHLYLEDIRRILEEKSDRHQCEYRVRNAQGEYVWVRCNGAVERHPEDGRILFAGTMTNLGFVSKYDSLTGFYHIFELRKQYQQMLGDGRRCALMLFGMDDFKRINEIYGFDAGDRIMRNIAQQLLSMPELGRCSFARMDGDKMCCMVQGNDLEELKRVHRLIENAVHQGARMENPVISMTASCGAALLPEHGENVDEIRANLEHALEQAKRTNRGGMAVYSKERHMRNAARLRLKESLRQAMDAGFEGFFLAYQPLIRGRDRKLFGAEALLRFSTPQMPMVSPAEMIPILEESGAIYEVGIWVIRTALSQVKQWRRMLPDFCVSVNVSYVQMQRPEFTETLIRELAASGLESDALLLELTESCKVSDLDQLSMDFARLRQQHIQVALDDFGTGYSSIEMLRRLMPTWIKIDHTFVASISENRLDQAVIEYLLQLSRRAGIKVCVEGIENAEILEFVQRYRPDLLQGYFFSHPLPQEAFERKYLL